ncbi:MAG: putative HTH-type transcriptional regulator [Ramlibacter sp.]|nr:putative HTH-type transcriptional regulator [Ramlibacter sp.]
MQKVNEPPNWLSDIAKEGVPRYVAIADAMERAVDSGALCSGDQLPPHRTLAKQLGLDVGTVSRAYAEIQRRGLTTGEVGRGTFVSHRKPDAPTSLWQSSTTQFTDLSHNFPETAPINPEAALLSEASEGLLDTNYLLSLQSDSGHLPHRQVMARWLESTASTRVTPDDVVITTGAQHGVLLGIQAVTQPNDVVLVERVAYFGTLAAVRFLGRRPVPVTIDREGLVPEDLERAFAETGARVVVCNPTLHNPTTAVMGPDRRAAIARICRKFDAVIVEDDVYVLLHAPSLPSLCSFAPERTIYVTSFAKVVGCGPRVGLMRAPPHLTGRIGAGLRSTSLMAPTPMVELMCRMVSSDGIERLAHARRAQLAERQVWADEILAGASAQRHPAAYHAWLRIGAWRSERFVAVARERGVAVTPGAIFSVEAETRDAAVRICICAAIDKLSLQQALRVLLQLVDEGPYGVRPTGRGQPRG